LEWSLLPHGKQLFSFLEVAINRFLYNLVPTTAALPWVVKPGRTWIRGNGPLTAYESALMASVRAVSDDFGRHVENGFSIKLQPRNIFLADVFDDKLENMKWNVPTPRRVLTPELVQTVMEREGLCHPVSLPSIWTVRPPDGITSVGVLWDEDIGQAVSGSKSEIWGYVLRKASDAISWCQAQGFTWENIDARWIEVIKHFDAIYTPGVRLDRGPNKIRLLFAGNAVFYALETMCSFGIKRDMKSCVHLGYRAERGEQARDRFGDVPVISGDFKACDLHFNATSMKAAWMGWQREYVLPESLMCMLYAYNVYAPCARWKLEDYKPQLILQDRYGINPSGGGGFVIIMNIYVRSLINACIAKLQDVPVEALKDETGLSFGDDHVLPRPTAKLCDWVGIMSEYGQDVSESEVWRGKFKFLRSLYGPDYERVPIIFSRFRNAACPEDPGILSRSRELNALALRAQLLPFAVVKQSNARWRTVYETLSAILVPGKQMMLEEYPTDAALAREVQSRFKDLDEMFFAKRAYQVDDSVKVFE